MPDYNGIFSLHALNFTPAAIDKTEKFLQVLSEDNALVSNVSFGALMSTTTSEGKQHEFTDQTTDRLTLETDVTDYYNEVDHDNTKSDSNTGNTKSDSNTGSTKLDVDEDNTKLDSDTGNTKADYGSTNEYLGTAILDNDSNLPDSGDANFNLEGNPQDSSSDSKLEDNPREDLATFQVVTKTISSEAFQTTPEHSTIETIQTEEEVKTTTFAELTSTIAEVQSNSSDALLTDSEDGPVETDKKQPDIFDQLMNRIQSHWLDFVGKMKLSVLDVWKTISKQMMDRMENFASAL